MFRDVENTRFVDDHNNVVITECTINLFTICYRNNIMCLPLHVVVVNSKQKTSRRIHMQTFCGEIILY